MRTLALVCAAVSPLLFSVVVQAADLSRMSPARSAPAICEAWGYSSLANEQNLSVVQSEIQARYAEAAEVSVRLATEASRSERITWAYASRTACGIALGMLSYRELDSDRLWNCECYHARMRAAMSR
jgi:hypothetical protein